MSLKSSTKIFRKDTQQTFLVEEQLYLLLIENLVLFVTLVRVISTTVVELKEPRFKNGLVPIASSTNHAIVYIILVHRRLSVSDGRHSLTSKCSMLFLQKGGEEK